MAKFLPISARMGKNQQETIIKPCNMSITISVIFDHRNRTKAGQNGPVELRITRSGKSIYVNTGIKVLAHQLTGGTIVGRTDADDLNRQLVALRRMALNKVNECLEHGYVPEPSEIKRSLWKSADDGSALKVSDWIAERLPGRGLKPRTQQRYEMLISRLNEFGRIITWEDVTTEKIYEFNTWLHQRGGDRGQPISDAGVYNYHKCLKSMLNLALRLERIKENPYDKLRGEFKRGDKICPDFLTEWQMQAVRELPLPSPSFLARVRDLCVFQMFTGMAWSDMVAFDMGMCSEENGQYIYRAQRIKTESPFMIQLLPPVVEVLERNNCALPRMSQQKYNQGLKIIGQAIGLSFGLHSHALRHTYATWALRNKVPLQIVSRMMGHKSIAMTMRYAKILTDDVCQEFDHLSKVVG